MNTEQLRVGDAERDEVTAALHEHFAQGRLTRDELDERLTATLSAKTVGDLLRVTRDLPPTGVVALFSAGARGPGWGRGPWEMGAAHWGRGPFASGWPRAGAYGRGPWPFRPFAPVAVGFFLVAAFTGAWWAIFPFFACAWFLIVFTGLRHARRWRRLR